MKIRNRLSIQFTALVASILLLFCLMIYYVSMVQLRADFYQLLHDRTVTTAYMYLEEDEFPPDLYETIQERYMRTLPQEVAQLFDMDNYPEFIEPSEEISYSDEKVQYIRSNHRYPDYHEFRRGRVQSVGFFYPDNQGDFVVIVSAVDTIGRSHLNNLAWILASGFALSLLVLFFAGRFFAAQSLKPIPLIVSQVNKISASNLHVRLRKGKEDDEISELVATFNKLLKRLEENFKIQQRFVANASHELRTPLTSMIGEIEVARAKSRSPDEYEEVLASIHHDALTLHELISGLLELAQAESEKLNELLEPIRVDELVLEASMQIESRYEGAKVNVNYKGLNGKQADFSLPGTRTLLNNVFVNVIDNAVKFTPGSATVDVVLSTSDDTIEVQIQDRGVGIAAEEQDKIFNPFYRSKKVMTQNGHGIGLSLVKRVLTVLRGDIEIHSEPGEGTLVIIRFRK